MNADRRNRILIVDDEPMNRDLLEGMLLPMGYEVFTAENGFQALERAHNSWPDVILLDIMMPRMDGFEVTYRLKTDPQTRGIPIIIVTALIAAEDRIRALKIGADEFLIKPVDRILLQAKVQALCKVKAYNDSLILQQKELEARVERRTEQLQKALTRLREASEETILRLSRAAEYKDGETYAHICRMSQYSAVIARKMGLDDENVELILYSSPMHDIGKIGISDSILLKPEKLSDGESDIMKQHTLIGARILDNSTSELIKYAEMIARTHHEKWDGTGYPRGLNGEEIPLAGRIAALADVFDALTTQRPYKDAIPVDEAIRMIQEQRGTHFDPEVVDAFLAAIREIRAIMDNYQDVDEDNFLPFDKGMF